MPIGKNAPKLFEKTTRKGSTTGTGRTTRTTGKGRSRGKVGTGSRGGIASEATKTTVYIKPALLDRLQNFAYWADSSFTKALNAAIEDGLKGKPTEPKPKPKFKL